MCTHNTLVVHTTDFLTEIYMPKCFGVGVSRRLNVQLRYRETNSSTSLTSISHGNSQPFLITCPPLIPNLVAI